MIFGPPSYLSDPTKELTVRVHDECNGSDVFGSDICTCRPYLIYGIEEAIKCAQRGGVGLVVYMRKEGRALGETLKCTSVPCPPWIQRRWTDDGTVPFSPRTDLVYNSRKRAGDTADKYFAATENIAGVKDMRFQALMPDVLHWLGVKKIDNMISMVSTRSGWTVIRPSTVRKSLPTSNRAVGYEIRRHCQFWNPHPKTVRTPSRTLTSRFPSRDRRQDRRRVLFRRETSPGGGLALDGR
jgi:hypothetical protein